MPRASGHSLALRLDSRATILATEYLATHRGDDVPGDGWVPGDRDPVAAASRVLVVQSS